jgi:hypothetical protein
MSAHTDWAQSLLDPAQPAPSGLVTWNHSDPARRLAVYRNNVMVSLVDALADSFPVTQQLVGEEFFRAMAQIFVREHPPRSRVLNHYGHHFPAFIGQFPPAAGLPYLADLALLEFLRLEALHAADALAMDGQSITAAMQDAQALPLTCWQLAPCLRLWRSPHAAVSLWAAHQEDGELRLQDIDLQQAESALIFRSDLDVMVLPVAPGMIELVEHLLMREPLGEAIEQALLAAPDFDITQALTVLIRHQLLVAVETPH